MPIRNQLFWIIGFVSLMLDQLTKYWVMQGMKLGQTTPLWPDVFHFTYVTNKGAAFSLFSESGGWLRWLSLIVSLGLIALAVFTRLDRWEQAGYGFVLGGALGNGIDRFVAGEVVDFLDFRLIRFPVFNLADIFINVGIICLLIATFRKPTLPNSKRSGRSNS